MIRIVVAAAALSLVAATAHADPCEAPVTGYRAGQVVEGPVIHAIDGDGFCLALGRDPSQWLEIRVSDWMAPELNEPGGREAKRVIDRQIGRHAACTVQRGHNGSTRSFDRVIASCRIEGVPIGVIMRAHGLREGGRGR